MPDLTANEISILNYLYEYRKATVARLAKDLDLGQSEVRRALAMLGPDVGIGMVEFDSPDAALADRARLGVAGITFLEILAG